MEYLSDEALTAIVLIISSIIGAVVVKDKHSKSNNNKEENNNSNFLKEDIISRTVAINNIEHLQEDVMEIKKNIQFLYKQFQENHKDYDSLINTIHDLEVEMKSFIKTNKKR